MSTSRTAICRGAIFKGFLDRPSTATNGVMVPPVNVASVIARQSVGVVYRPEFVAGVHLDIDKCWSDMRGVWLADNQISWYIKKVGFCSIRCHATEEPDFSD